MVSRLSFDLDVAKKTSEFGIDLRSLIQTLSENDLSHIDSIGKLIQSLETLKQLEGGDNKKDNRDFFYLCLKVLYSEFVCVKMALEGSEDLIKEKMKLDILKGEFLHFLSKRFQSQMSPQLMQKLNNKIAFDKVDFISMLKDTPFPTSYFTVKEKNVYGSHVKEASTKKKKINSLLRIIVYIDKKPLVNVVRLQSGTMYTLRFDIKGVGWPKSMPKLRMDFITTCPDSQYAVSILEAERPNVEEEDEFQVSIPSTIQFNSIQSLNSENLAFAIRAAFHSDTDFRPVQTIGTNQLFFRVISSDASLFLSGYKRLDQHVANLLEPFIGTPTESEFHNLLPVLEAITNLLGAYTQSAIFKGISSIKESEFQKEVLRDLRVRLGQEVQEHSSQAGGSTDLKFRDLVIELKVEKDRGDRPYIAEKYSKQTTQYQGVEAKQISVLLVLDLTEKISPPGDIRNDVLLVDVPTHGGADKDKRYPSKAILFVVNGNIVSPSEYSK